MRFFTPKISFWPLVPNSESARIHLKLHYSNVQLVFLFFLRPYSIQLDQIHKKIREIFFPFRRSIREKGTTTEKLSHFILFWWWSFGQFSVHSWTLLTRFDSNIDCCFFWNSGSNVNTINRSNPIPITIKIDFLMLLSNRKTFVNLTNFVMSKLNVSDTFTNSTNSKSSLLLVPSTLT